ncbi:MAG: hypothetical protein K6G18_05340, partial [Treponema sp.]|nr:hypothetical protein [Treponema sp.]
KGLRLLAIALSPQTQAPDEPAPKHFVHFTAFRVFLQGKNPHVQNFFLGNSVRDSKSLPGAAPAKKQKE